MVLDDRGCDGRHKGQLLSRIRRLPRQLADQIAAGEVVARPASVIKELVENALDAGARKIRIEIDGGGIQRMLVVDDGCGMDEEDARMALVRHATSKLAKIEDLHAMATFGFRGEALPSIASVSRFVLRTRCADTDGVELRSEGGSSPTIAPWGGARGTTIEVHDLFYNVPARRKFLRAVSTESAHVGDTVRAVALSHPNVHVELSRDGRRAKRWLRAETREERARTIFDDVELVACHGERGPMRVEAYLSTPAKARTGAGALHFFVCGRPVQDRALARAVATAYGDGLERGRFPVGALFLELPLDLVDVNVHPQKAEVRFAHARAVTDAVHGVVASTMAPRMPASTSEPAATRLRRPAPAGDESWTWSGPTQHTPRPIAPQPSRPFPLRQERPHEGAAPLRFIGPASRWWLYEDESGVTFVDPAAALVAHARLRAEREWEAGGLVSQRLLFPCEIAPAEPLASSLDIAARFGFEVRPHGDKDRVSVQAVPRAFAGVAPERLLAPVVAALDNEDELPGDVFAAMAQQLGLPDPMLAEQLTHAPEIVAQAAVKRVAWDELE